MCGRIGGTPSTIGFKAYYFGRQFYFLDIDKWIDRLSIFGGPNPCDVVGTLQGIEDHLVPLYHANYKYDVVSPPSSLAKISRTVIKNIEDFYKYNRNDFLKEVRSCNSTGYNYIAKPNHTYEEELYYFDVKSMYPYMMTSKMYPCISRTPIFYEGFCETNGLAIYHIDYIKAVVKPNFFPSVFCQQEQRARMGMASNHNIEWYANGNTLDGWITSVDLQMLKEHYDIEILEIDYSYIYPHQKIGSEIFGDKLQYYFNMKENATNPFERQAYKGLINKFFGCLSMKMNNFKYKIDSILDPVQQVRIKATDEDKEIFSPLDLGAFTTAYARQYIIKLALLAGYENVACISTDAVVVNKAGAEKLQKYVGNKMGDLSLDRVMYNTRWWRINTYEWQDGSGVWNAKIAGLPSYKYKHGTTLFVIPKLIYNHSLHCYCRELQTFNLEEDLCQNEIDYISAGIEL